MCHWIVLFFCLLGIQVSSLEVTLNTQLDKKLDSLSKKSISNKVYNLNNLRNLEINGLRIIDEQEVLNEITVFKGDELDPYVINRNIKRIEALGFFTSVESSLVDFEGGKKWIITVDENPVINDIQFIGNAGISSSNLLTVIQSNQGDIFSFKNVRNDIDKIEKDYSTKGYLFTKVKKVGLPTKKDPVLKFIIEESTFESISVSGNAKTKDYVILREIDLKIGRAHV